jgi:PGF-CTERM protein
MVHRTSVLTVAVLVALSGVTAGVAVVGAQQSAATVQFSSQTTGGHAVTVDSVTLPEGGFVTIHDATVTEGQTLQSVVGTSAYLPPGTHEDVTVTLTDPLSADGTYVAMPHTDDGDRVYEFVSANANADGPYTADGAAVVDTANLTVSATLSASAQPTDGESVVVDRVELSQPGFVVVHDETLASEGDAVGSVVGASDRLSAGVHEDVRVTLDESVDAQTVVAMAHVDSDDDGAYEFPDADGPFTTGEGEAVVAPVALSTPDTASLAFANQSSGGHVVTVGSVFLPEGGFVVAHDERLADGEAVESVRGASDYLAPGLHRNVEIVLDDPLGEDETLTPMAHRDTDGDEAYEFPDADGPYTEDGGAVVASGAVTVSASVTASDQRSGGHTVTVDRVDLSEGGFVVVHDASLFAGAVEGSVLGASDYLAPGVHRNVTVTLDTPANESGVVVPMAHRDTDGDEAYTFPDADGPYTADGSAVVDTAHLAVPASVTMADQSTDGETVVVDSVTLSDGGFVTVHDATVTEGAVFDSVRGTSAYLAPGTHEDVRVTLDDPVEQNTTLVPMAHRDTDGDEAYTFVETEGSADGPYVAGGAVVDTATVTYAGGEMSQEMDEETTDEATGMADTDTETDDTTTTETPGFGVVVAVLALLGAALLATRRN